MNELIQKHNYLTNDLSAKTTQFLSIFCPVKEKNIKIICKTSDYYKAIYGTYLDTNELSIYQLNIVLKKNKYILPTTICQQAPPCHIYHIDPFHVRSPHECYYCRNKKPNSTFIYDW
jgi:hypothetical protein